MSYKNVEPRYKLPVKPKERRPVVFEMEKFPASKQWAGTTSRYAEPKKGTTPRQPEKHQDPLAGWNEANFHRDMAAKAGFGNISSKFMEDMMKKVEHPGDLSPRRVVEMANERDRRELSWRGTGPRPLEMTFDKMRKEAEMAGVVLPPSGSKVTGSSTIGSYIRDGTPINHHFMKNWPPERCRKHRSEKHFNAPGVQSTTFDKLKSKTIKREGYAREEAHVRERLAHLKEAQVPKRFTPRVAKLTPAHVLEEARKSANSTPAASTSPTPGPM